ncbi:hypothetical protein [Ktedonobacter racemifer]|uniref:Exonuclease RNase T and DNA polymerase III n=1 Tax=Ktedonobacter racemifer DSM 44963 TaxID=485913 RepID=D6TGA1_KTERA|nr:hypothetical protein [Ktedonobacter racemifer]EFH88803.1 hypothetical protein Krac_10301 [Ktedonobacter racemifer DSM 44963]
MSKSLDAIVVTLGTGVADERAKGPVQSYQDLIERVQHRAHLYEGLQYIEEQLQTLRRTVQSLPSLPPEREVLWANAVLALPNMALLEIDTTGLSEDAEIVRVTLLSPTGTLIDDILIKPKYPLTPRLSEINGLRNEDLEQALSIREAWPRIAESLEGRYILSFAQDFDREKLNETALRDQLPRINFIGEDLQLHLGHFLGNSYIKLAEACTRIGHPLPERPHQTGVDRARGQLHTLQAMANAVTSCNTSTPAPGADNSEDQSFDTGEHPF